MSKGTRYTQQSYKVSDAFPFEWIKKKWKEAFYITSMATAGIYISKLYKIAMIADGYPEVEHPTMLGQCDSVVHILTVLL